MAENSSKFSFNSFINFVNQNFTILLLVLVVFGLGFLSGSNWGKCTAEECLAYGAKNGQAAQPNQPVAEKPQGPSEEVLKKTPEVTEEDHQQGADNPQLTLIEYSDYECPYCNRFQLTMQQVIEEYGDQVRWVYRHFPLQFHQNAQPAAEFGECVAQYEGREAFWEYSDLLFEKMGEYFEQARSGQPEGGNPAELENLLAMSHDLGWDSNRLKSCVDKGEMTQKVKDQLEAAKQAGISGTPATVAITADGQYKLISGAQPFDSVKETIEELLK
ncbi:MAG: thioredoxin domain-containing protein [Candidatus Pacebacteria bacterium]|nr:thioredoxin domain-containing protein [Candidatus Paceibacterota bacterium]